MKFQIEKFTNNQGERGIKVFNMENARESISGNGKLIGDLLFSISEWELLECPKEEIIEDYLIFEGGLEWDDIETVYEMLITCIELKWGI